MTCRTCGYEAAYELPTCPRCGAVASAEPASPYPGPVSGNASTSAYAAGPAAQSAEPSALERTVNRAALRADLARGEALPTPEVIGADIEPSALPALGDDSDWLMGVDAGHAAYPTADDAEYPGLPSVAHPPALPDLPSYPGPATFQPVLGPSFAEGQASAAPTPATLGDRFLANVVDGLVMLAALLPFSFIVSLMDTRRGVGQVVGTAISLLLMVFIVAYAPILIGRHGRTIGKNALRIEVQDVRTGRPIGVGMGFARWIVLALMGTPCYLGYLSVFLDKSGYHRGWHDSAANSRVVKTTTQIPVLTLLRLRG